MILAGGNLAIRAAQQATTTIPILGITDDMVGSGLVNSLARPGGNTTPAVAPSGRVRMNAAQNKSTRDMFIHGRTRKV